MKKEDRIAKWETARIVLDNMLEREDLTEKQLANLTKEVIRLMGESTEYNKKSGKLRNGG